MTSVVGIDLAWGDRATSGVVVADLDGSVQGSATVTSDDDIVALVPDGPVVLAIDAPLVVPNDTGSRPCDRILTRCFRRFDAGAYPANRSIPWLRHPRGARLARRLGASLDPYDIGRADRVALEVYPHAAAVALFRLERILPYKPRRARSRELRQEALTALLDHLETLRSRTVAPLDVTVAPRWSVLRDAVSTAPTKAALDRVEDEVDAFLCAAVGMLAAVAPQHTCIIGRTELGAVVTPVDDRVAACLEEAT